MTQKQTPFSFGIIGKFGSLMYDTLLYQHHMSRSTAKLIEWKELPEQEGIPGLRAYQFEKNNKNYILPQTDSAGRDTLEQLPIRIKRTDEMISKNGDVVHVIDRYASFKVTPEKIYDPYELIHIDGISNKNELAWTLWKIIAMVARYRRVVLKVSGPKNAGKTSWFQVLNQLIGKSYVITRPSSFPGICLGITSDGVMVIDEVAGDVEAAKRRSIGDGLYQLGDMRNVIKSGTAGSMAHGTKPSYNVPNLSTVILYNYISYYKDKKNFFDFMFSNSKAINDRFLALAMPEDTSLLPGQFSKSTVLTEKHKQLFIAYMKSAEWMHVNWDKEVDWDYVHNKTLQYEDIQRLRDTAVRSFNEIAGGIYYYLKYHEEFRNTAGEAFDTMFNSMVEEVYSWHRRYYQHLEDYSIQHEDYDIEVPQFAEEKVEDASAEDIEIEDIDMTDLEGL